MNNGYSIADMGRHDRFFTDLRYDSVFESRKVKSEALGLFWQTI